MTGDDAIPDESCITDSNSANRIHNITTLIDCTLLAYCEIKNIIILTRLERSHKHNKNCMDLVIKIHRQMNTMF